MTDTANIWSEKTDDEVATAASQMTDHFGQPAYTPEGERLLRAELRRRGMEEPPLTSSMARVSGDSHIDVERPAPSRSQQPGDGRTYTIGEFTYFMTYFEAQFRNSGDARGVADQFTSFVAHYAASGFEFYRSDSIPYRITPGCLAGLFGAKETFGYTTVVSFRKKV